MPRSKIRFDRPALTLAIASCAAGAAAAQTAPEPPAGAASAPAADASRPSKKNEALATVVVTATRRIEPLVKVPMAVSVIGGERIQAEGLSNLRDVVADVPSLQFRTAASAKDQAVFLRGMGTVSTSPAVEPTTATVVDGVPLARQGQANLDLQEVERIEVLRGPQGTLFGKNASAGVVQIVTKMPTPYFAGFGEAAFAGGGNERRVKAGLSGPLVEGQWNAMVNVLSASYGGNVTNVYNGQTVNGYRHEGAAAKFEYVGSKDFRALVSMDRMTSHDTTPQGVVTSTRYSEFGTGIVTNNPLFATALAPVVASPTNRQINSNYDTYADDMSSGISLQLDWTTPGGYKWTSITASRCWTNTQLQDQTRLPVLTTTYPLMHDRGELAFNQGSQELRVASPVGGDHDYVAGFFYMSGSDDELYQRETTRLVSGAPVITNGAAAYSTTNTNYALFGEWTQHFSATWKGLAGLRLVHDDLDYSFDRTSTSAVAVSGIQTAFKSQGAIGQDGYAARLGTRFDPTANSNIYFTVARGYKGPAYNIAFSMLPQDTGALRPETSIAYELGYKTTFDNNRSTFSVALFRQNFKDYQVNFRDLFNGSIITRLVNAGRVSTEGVEAELSMRPVNDWRIGASMAYTRARVGQFTCPAGTTAACNINGQSLPFAPDWKVSLSTEYKLHFGASNTVAVGTGFNWQSKTQYDINQTPETVEPARGIWNAHANWSNDAGWTVSVIGKNLANKDYSSNLVRFGGGIVRWVPRDAQRYFGVSVRKEF